MTLKVNVVPTGYILVDTNTHKTLGVFQSKVKAERRRRYLQEQNRRHHERKHGR